MPTGANNLDPTHWTQFGLAGVVIAALFYVIIHFVKQFREEREGILKSHKEERTIWREDANNRADASRERERDLQKVLMSLEGVIREAGTKNKS